MKDRIGDLTAHFLDFNDSITIPVETNVFLKKLFSKVKLRHSTILTEVTPPDYVRDELELFSSDIRQIADTIRLKLKDIKGQGYDSTSVYQRIQETQYNILTLRLAEIMRVHNQELLSFRNRSKERMQRQLEISGRVITDEEMEMQIQNQNPAVFSSKVLTSQALDEIQARHRDILGLESGLRELHAMFLDVTLLVSSQGDMANNIAESVTRAGDYVAEGKDNIKQAFGHKKSWRIRLPPLPSFKRKAKQTSSEGT
ncbi:hypothetical protein DNTS_028897 [Danionella cerebrum]|uniref:t-SNARE coiled-coil homology domain-containing protein n=1 Tax=Danionella cerebrum TaxID=2873325 RepID=A0A553N4V5_9TELE|nr:hypothetical protein DNTS_028897 [Danionella translucida]